LEWALDRRLDLAVPLLEHTGELLLTQGRSSQHFRFARRFRELAVATTNAELAALGQTITGNAAGYSARGLAGEERRGRLEEAVGAYREALRFRTGERAPLQYAVTQNNLGNALSELAEGLSGEDRRARLEEAVGAYRE